MPIVTIRDRNSYVSFERPTMHTEIRRLIEQAEEYFNHGRDRDAIRQMLTALRLLLPPDPSLVDVPRRGEEEDQSRVKEGVAMQDWQPIETAPKDWMSVLGVDSNGERRTTHWDENEDAWIMDVPYAHSARTWEPTHWMPLPPPPQNLNENAKRPARKTADE
jgi:hypothetical protein